MSTPLMYQQDYFVVLESQQPEQILTAAELVAKLEQVLERERVELPKTVAQLPTLTAQAHHLRDNYYELAIAEDGYLQWYAVRLEKP